MEFRLEVCVDSVESALAADRGGADRIELCSNLIIGGTSPSAGLFQQIKKAVSLPVHVLIRPRFGDFLYNTYEIEEMKEEIGQFFYMGADGIVIGMLKPDGSLDVEGMRYLLEDIPFARDNDGKKNCYLTLHRAFDMCKDPLKAYEEAAGLGFDYILTSGQKNSALSGIECLKMLSSRGDNGGPKIMAGGGIRGPEDVKLLYKEGIRNFHMSGKVTYESGMTYRNPDVSMGLDLASEYTLWKTDEGKIRRVALLRDSL